MNRHLPALMATALVTWSNVSLAQERPTPVDPYPLAAAGWGPEAGNGLYYSRWVEDWTAMRAAGSAPSLKALPLGKDISLTFNTETRMRYDDAASPSGTDVEQGLLRSVLGAELRFNPGLRLYAELGSGYSAGTGNATTANFDNKQSLQQLFLDVRRTVNQTLVGVMVGRQEFADGPRQLLSLSDGPNLHRTWNGTRFYLHKQGYRVGAFDLRATRMGRGGFDETIDRSERLQGANASFVIARGAEDRNVYLEPFWIHSRNASLGSPEEIGADDRHTFGARLWGQRNRVRFDATMAHQSGRYAGRRIDAWGLFLVQSLALADLEWKPRLTAHVDVASGDRASGDTHEGFNQLYSSSNYLGEGRFLALRNLMLLAPGVSVSPTASTSFAAEYGFARRLTTADAVYGGGFSRGHAGTRGVAGQRIGNLLKISGNWSGDWRGNNKFTLTGGYEYLDAGQVLKAADVGSAGYAYFSVTLRY